MAGDQLADAGGVAWHHGRPGGAVRHRGRTRPRQQDRRGDPARAGAGPCAARRDGAADRGRCVRGRRRHRPVASCRGARRAAGRDLLRQRARPHWPARQGADPGAGRQGRATVGRRGGRGSGAGQGRGLGAQSRLCVAGVSGTAWHKVPTPNLEVLTMRLAIRTAALAATMLLPILSTPAMAQSYPSRPVKIIVPFGGGGPADVFSRQLGQALQESLKQPFVIEDRPGAGSIIGTNEVAKAAPDGYTLLAMSNTHTVNESLRSDKPFQLMRDFVPVAAINYSDLVMVIHPSVQAKNLKEFIALAKKAPGKLNYGSSGPGTPYHMAAELFKSMTGTNIVHVPFKASGEMRSAVIGGHVQMAFDAI